MVLTKIESCADFRRCIWRLDELWSIRPGDVDFPEKQALCELLSALLEAYEGQPFPWETV